MWTLLRIRDVYLGSWIQQQKKEGSKKISCLSNLCFVAINFTKIKIKTYIFEQIPKNLSQLRIDKINPKTPRNMSCGSVIRKKLIPDPGVKKHRIRIRNTCCGPDIAFTRSGLLKRTVRLTFHLYRLLCICYSSTLLHLIFHSPSLSFLTNRDHIF